MAGCASHGVPTLARTLLLALLLGNAPGGTAQPGQGVGGAINVTLRGPETQDCRTAYQGAGLLAVVPLAAEVLRKDGGCKW